MKKNISINISGIIFHIEEDGFERLDGYLKSIKRYFSAFDESEEIILDIENRVAEIFLAKLNDGKQVITAEDVDALIRTMGNVSDFQAVEDGEPEGAPDEPEMAEEGAEGTREDKKLYRDRSRQIIGGVAAGIAHYLRVDPLWIRLVFLIMMADLAVTRAFAPVVFIAYLVLWAILPGRFDLQEDKRVKKIYRDPDGQVLGGVASGIANYFGVSVVSIRILFVLFILLGGAGFFVYIVLWIIVPPAKTVTEKLEMKGEPVTLENIENNIKGGLRMDPEADESIFTKILLFPFRLMAELIGIMGRIAGPFFRFALEVIRVAAGVFIIIMSLGFLYALVVGIALWAGVEAWWMFPFWWQDVRITMANDLNWMVIRDTLGFWIAIPAFIAGLIPILFYMLLGIAALAKRWVARPAVGWSLFGIWVISLVTLAVSVPRFWYEFREEGDDITSTVLPALEDRTLTIMADRYQSNGEIDLVDLYIYPTDDDEIRMERKVSTRGRDSENIKENASMVVYDVAVNDSVLTIPRELTFTEGAVFRGQEVSIALYIPKGQAFYLD
ncbi:MAG: PspC domain-containing protein, partial [Bacteroidota bacterium]